MLDRLPFKRVVALDFEFSSVVTIPTESANRSGERPRPVCSPLRKARFGGILPSPLLTAAPFVVPVRDAVTWTDAEGVVEGSV